MFVFVCLFSAWSCRWLALASSTRRRCVRRRRSYRRRVNIGGSYCVCGLCAGYFVLLSKLSFLFDIVRTTTKLESAVKTLRTQHIYFIHSLKIQAHRLRCARRRMQCKRRRCGEEYVFFCLCPIHVNVVEIVGCMRICTGAAHEFADCGATRADGREARSRWWSWWSWSWWQGRGGE